MFQVLALLYLSTITSVVSVAVPAPPLELQDNIISDTDTNINNKELEPLVNTDNEKEVIEIENEVAAGTAVPSLETTAPTLIEGVRLPAPAPAPAPHTISSEAVSSTFASLSSESLPSSSSTPAPPPKQLSARLEHSVLHLTKPPS